MTTVAAETWTGSNGASWPAQWTGSAGNGSGSSSTIQGNKGRQTTAAAAYAYRVDRLNVSIPTDFEATLSVTFTGGTEHYGLVHFRGGATNQHKLNSSYQLRIVANTIEIYKVGATGTETWFASAGLTHVSTDTIHLRIFCSGTTIRVRAWKNADPEPGTWNIDTTDSTYTGNGFLLSCFNGNDAVADTWDWDNLTISDFAGGGGTHATVTPSVVAAVSAIPTPGGLPGVSPRRAHTGFRWTASPPALPAANTHLQKAPWHSTHMVGFGSGNVNPSPGTLNWSSLDAAVQRMRTAGSSKMSIVLASAPGWMKTTSTDPAVWASLDNNLTVAPVSSHYQDFANLCAQVAQRYSDVRHFTVWDGMRGFFLTASNRWDYEGYTQMYNLVYSAIKAVRPDAQIGGPYVFLHTSDGLSAGDDPPSSILAGRTLAYFEDFNGPSVPSGWYANNWMSNRNGEQQFWRPQNVSFSGSRVHLRIETAAQHNARVGFTNNGGAAYVCGMLESSLQWGKGLFAFKCKLPKVPHTWQGPWLFDLNGGRLEIDVCEDPNLPINGQPGYAFNFHYANPNGQAGPVGVVHDVTQDTIYAVDWQDNVLIFYKNWVETGRFTNASQVGQLIGRTMMALLQTAVGGAWPGNADASTDAALPAVMEVDWMKVWQGSGTPQPAFVPSSVSVTGSMFDQRDLDLLTYWKNNATGYDYIAVAGDIGNTYGNAFQGTVSQQLGKFTTASSWLRSNLSTTKPIYWQETYLYKAKTLAGQTQTQLEDLWFTMLTNTEASVAGEVVYFTVGEFPATPVYEPTIVTTAGASNRMTTLVADWEGTASASATVAASAVLARASVPAPVVSTGATVTATRVAAVAAIGVPSLTTQGSATVSPLPVAARASVENPTVTATTGGPVHATVTPATVEARAGGMEVEAKGRRAVRPVYSSRWRPWWFDDVGLWP